MDELEELRLQIDEIDKELASCFERRMDVVRRISDIKLARKAEVLDSKREEEVLCSRRPLVQDTGIRPFWEEEVRLLMRLSKEYQWTLREDSPSRKK